MRAWGWLVVLSAGCGPDRAELPPMEPAPLQEVCEQPSPVRILELAPDQTLISDDAAVLRFEDRLYFVVGRTDTGYFSENRVEEETVVMSVGPCGESPRVIASDIRRVYTDPHLPGLVLGDAPEGVVALDPEGAAPPEMLIPKATSMNFWTDHGIVDRGRNPEGGDAMVLRPYPAAPEDDDLPATVLYAPWPGHHEVRGNDVFFQIDFDGVFSITLPGGEPRQLTGEVWSFQTTSDGRFLVWWTYDEATNVYGVHVLDRSTGNDTHLADLAGFFDVYDAGVVLRPDGWPSEAVHTVVTFPDLERVDVPERVAAVGSTDGELWIGWKNPQSFLIFDPATGNANSLFEGYGLTRAYPDQLTILRSDRPGAHDLSNQGMLFAAPYDRSGSFVLADRATPGMHVLDDGRVLTPVDVTENVGTLAVTDFDGVTRWQIDTDVIGWLRPWQKPAGYDPDVALYSVSDGDRSGIWLARLPAE